MAEAKGSCLEHVRDSGVNVLLIAFVGVEMGAAQKRRQIFVNENILKRSDDDATGPLENVFITPRWILLLHLIRQLVVPAEKENCERQQCGILIRARITENWN